MRDNYRVVKDQDELESLPIPRNIPGIAQEIRAYVGKGPNKDLIGLLAYESVDNQFVALVLGRSSEGFRCINLAHSIDTEPEAEMKLFELLSEYEGKPIPKELVDD